MENILATVNGFRTPQREVEETLQSIFFAVGCYRVHDPVEIQIAKELRDMPFVTLGPLCLVIEQNALKGTDGLLLQIGIRI